jgi:uncharacterized membrane protein
MIASDYFLASASVPKTIIAYFHRMNMQYDNYFDKNRLEIFFDAILAIVLTILVLEFKVPRIEHPTTQQLVHSLRELLPVLFSYLMSFLTIIALWMDHQRLFHHITRINKKFVMLNFLFLASVSILPFTTAFAGEYFENSFAAAIFCSSIFFSNFCFAWLFLYPSQRKMMSETFYASMAKSGSRLGMAGLVIEALSIPVAFLSTTAAYLMVALVIVVHMTKK